MYSMLPVHVLMISCMDREESGQEHIPNTAGQIVTAAARVLELQNHASQV